MKILHISDTHGMFKNLNQDCDCVLHTGDFFPNQIYYQLKMVDKEIEYQETWIKQNIFSIKRWIGNKTFLFVLGNHDFLSHERVEDIFNSAGIQAFSLFNKHVTFNNLKFYGFPYWMEIGRIFNYECSDEEMNDNISLLSQNLTANPVDILACHCGPSGVLNLKNGNNKLRDCISSLNKKPKVIAFGHEHSNYGTVIMNDILYSNAATVQNIITVQNISTV